jgi:hypothetical protein
VPVRSADRGTSAADGALTSAYIGFLIPLMIELQHIELQPRP